MSLRPHGDTPLRRRARDPAELGVEGVPDVVGVLEAPLDAVPPQDQRSDQGAEELTEIVGEVSDRGAFRGGRARDVVERRILHDARPRWNDERPRLPVPELREDAIVPRLAAGAPNGHTRRRRHTLHAVQLGLGGPVRNGRRLGSPCVAVPDLDERSSPRRLGAEVGSGDVLTTDRDAMRARWARNGGQDAVAVQQRRNRRPHRPRVVCEPHRVGREHRVATSRRAHRDASSRHGAGEPTEAALDHRGRCGDVARRHSGEHPGRDQEQDGPDPQDAPPSVDPPTMCRRRVRGDRRCRHRSGANALPQAHGGIMQPSNADNGLIAVPPSGVLRWSGPMTAAWPSAV